jgi:hypothetical protein
VAFALLFLLRSSPWSSSSPDDGGGAGPEGREPLAQPDGTIIWVTQFGDERVNGLRTHDGYTILLDEVTGFWVYAEEGPEAASGRALRRGARPARRAPGGSRSDPRRPGSTRAGAPRWAARQPRSQAVLVIFADFTPSVRNSGTTAPTLASKFFGLTSSVSYYGEVSYGLFTVTPAAESDTALGGIANDGIVSVTLGYAHPNPDSTINDVNRTITRDALIAADPFVNFAAFDTDANGTISVTELHVVIIVAGFERSYSSSPCGVSVWGHRWSLFPPVPAPTLDGKAVGAFSGGGGYTQFGEWHCALSVRPGRRRPSGSWSTSWATTSGSPTSTTPTARQQESGTGVMGSGSWNGVAFPGTPRPHGPWSKFFEAGSPRPWSPAR